MITRLIWKEYRERRWWGLCWTLAILGVSLFGQGQAFTGGGEPLFLSWHALPWVLALLTGLGAYTSEMGGGRALFAYSRPIAWWQLAIAKLLFGGIILVGVPLLAAAIYAFTCPEPYRHFLTVPNILAGVWGVAWKMGLCYIFGLACSLLLPGLAGSVLALAGILVVVMPFVIMLDAMATLSGIYIDTIVYQGKPMSEAIAASPFVLETKRVAVLVAIIGGVWLAVVGGALRLVRLGPTQGTDWRLKRFVLPFIGVLLGSILLALLLPAAWEATLLMRPRFTEVSPSPTGKYALVGYERRFNPLGYPPAASGSTDQRYKIIRLADGKRISTFSHTYDQYLHTFDFCWAGDDVVFFPVYKTPGHPGQTVIQDLTSGKISTVDGWSPWRTLSPDQQVVMFGDVSYESSNTEIRNYWFVDLKHGKKLPIVFHTDRHSSAAMWESNSTVTYFTPDNKRHRVRVR